MNKKVFDDDFNVEELSSEINTIMSKWSVQRIEMNGPNWVIFDYDNEKKYLFQFEIPFDDLKGRIKLEDLKLNVIHHIESLKDETTYVDYLTTAP